MLARGYVTCPLIEHQSGHRCHMGRGGRGTEEIRETIGLGSSRDGELQVEEKERSVTSVRSGDAGLQAQAQRAQPLATLAKENRCAARG
jgi:hypothetical protein